MAIPKESSPRGNALKIKLNIPFRLHPDFIEHTDEELGHQGERKDVELDIEGLGKGRIEAELLVKNRPPTPLEEIRLRHISSLEAGLDEIEKLGYEAWDLSLTIDNLSEDQTKKLKVIIFFQGRSHSSEPVFEDEGSGKTFSFFFDWIDESGQPLSVKKETDLFSELQFLVESQ